MDIAAHPVRNGWFDATARLIAVGALAGLIDAEAAPDAATPAAADKRIEIARFAAPPTIDGRVDAEEWANAIRVRDLHQVRPVEFAVPSEATVWYLAYDDRTLYIAAVASDRQPERIVAREFRQGASIGSDDSLRVVIDPFNNKRSGYAFGLNPNGVRVDGIYTNGTQLSDEWDGIWRGAAVLVDEGWSMEMAIPFDTLNFDPAKDTWGLNLRRKIARLDETIAWVSRNGAINPTVAGEVSGLFGMDQGLGLEVSPSMSATGIRDREDGDDESSLNPSLDLAYKVGGAFNAILTINTDFAATEVDDRQLNLQRFSLFFPEKRLFFLTDFDIFQFGGVPAGSGGSDGPIGLFSGTNGLAFFSRRIGLSDDREPVDIRYGGKISGRVGQNDFGALYIREAGYDEFDETDFVVARVTRKVLSESTVGAIFTSGDPASDADNTLTGVDFQYLNTRLGTNRSAIGQFWLQQSDNAGVGDADRAYSAVLSFPANVGFEFGGQYQRVEQNFRPPVGFANRTGVELTGLEAGFSRVFDNARTIQRIEHSVAFERWEFIDTGRIQTQDLDVEFLTLRTPSGDRLRLRYSHSKEGLLPDEQPLDDIGVELEAREYSFDRYSVRLDTASHRPLSFRLDVSDGGYYDGDRLQVRPRFRWVPNRYLRFDVEYRVNRYAFPEGTATTREVRLSNGVAFNPHLSLRTLAQFDNVSDDIGLNLLFRYNIAAGRDVWLALNHNWVEDPETRRFQSTVSSAAARLRYTLRY